jgi:hypothetical protein
MKRACVLCKRGKITDLELVNCSEAVNLRDQRGEAITSTASGLIKSPVSECDNFEHVGLDAPDIEDRERIYLEAISYRHTEERRGRVRRITRFEDGCFNIIELIEAPLYNIHKVIDL